MKIAEVLRYDSFNHLDGPNETVLGFSVGDYVRAGQNIGLIATVRGRAGYTGRLADQELTASTATRCVL